MTDYSKIKQAAADERRTAEAARARRARHRRRPRALPQPVFGGQPYGARQCAACCRWLPADHFWRRQRRRFVKRCASCIGAGARPPRCGCAA